VRFVAKNKSGAGTGRGRGGDNIPPAEKLSDDYRADSVLPLLMMEGDARLDYEQKMVVLDAILNNVKKMRLRLRAQAIGVRRFPRPAKMTRTRCGRNRPPRSHVRQRDKK
jgi:hypothetical protein